MRVKKALYPVLVDSHFRDGVEGMLYHDLMEEELRRLDRFEGEEYDRKEVCVAMQQAQVYVLADNWGHIADTRPWRPEQVQKEQLEAFCSECKEKND